MENNFGTPMPSGGSGTNAREAVSLPAILLMVMAGITVLLGLFNLLQSAGATDPRVQEMLNDPNLPENARQMLAGLTSRGAQLGIGLPYVILNAIVFFGALKMKNLQGYGLANAAAIISLIPCCGPCYCLSIPVGIWALVVLRKPEVRAAFT